MTKMIRGEEDLRIRSTKVSVRMWMEMTFVVKDLREASRVDMVPEATAKSRSTADERVKSAIILEGADGARIEKQPDVGVQEGGVPA